MPALSYSVTDFVPFTKILSADVNTRFADIKTLLNTTKLDNANIQNLAITTALINNNAITTAKLDNGVVNGATTVTGVAADSVFIADASDSGNFKKALISDIVALGYNSNNVINGNFDFWQRNTTFTTPSSGAVTADRFKIIYDGTIGTFALSRQAFALGQTDVPNEPLYHLRWNQTAAGSASTIRDIRHRIESVRTFAGASITLAFWMKADAARTVGVAISQNFGTGGSPSTEITSSTQNVSVTTAWQRFSVTFAVPSISGKTLGTGTNDYLELRWILPLNTTMTVDLAQIMCSSGSVAASFVRSGMTLQEELANCQRFYSKSYLVDTVPGSAVEGYHVLRIEGMSSVDRTVYLAFSFPVGMKKTPTVVPYSQVTGTINTVDFNGTERAGSVLTNGPVGAAISASAGAASATLQMGFHWTSDAEI